MYDIKCVSHFGIGQQRQSGRLEFLEFLCIRMGMEIFPLPIKFTQHTGTAAEPAPM